MFNHVSFYSCVIFSLMVVGCKSSDDGPKKDNDEEVLEGSGGGKSLDSRPHTCLNPEGTVPEVLSAIGCRADFDAVAVEPTDTSLPGALSTKFIIDRTDDHRIYFQNSNQFHVHYDFAVKHLSAASGFDDVGEPDVFLENYKSDQRRLILGAITYYEAVETWALELAPYDTASNDLIVDMYDIVSSHTYFGDELKFHPSTEQEAQASELSGIVPQVTTGTIYDGIDYQPLTLATSCGKLVFFSAEELLTNYVTHRDIVVLDSVPNDISVAQGIVTGEFQTPLSHVNVLSQNRGTPNMALKGAFDSPELRAMEGKWVTLTVGANSWSVVESDPEAAESCLVKPEPVNVSPMDLSVTTIVDILDVYDPNSALGMKEYISSVIPAYGGKASHYGALAHLAQSNDKVRVPKAFSIPVYFYNQFMVDNGLDIRLNEMLVNPDFVSEPAVRDEMLNSFRDDIRDPGKTVVDPDLVAEVEKKIADEFSGARMRFRSSTNAEDLGDFTGAGLYNSKSADLDDPDAGVEATLRKVWASIWFFRAFEERDYRGIAHDKVGMAILSHRSFPDEEANGVAITSDPTRPDAPDHAFYVNVQYGGESVVQPGQTTTTDQYRYFDGGDVEFIAHSNLVPEGQTVLDATQTHELAVALKAIHEYFYEAYGKENASGWYGMDIEFKFDQPIDGATDSEPVLFIKQARPFPDPG